MAGQPDLFVVCKKCGSEVSPYITECPYCGTRLRKRAPKIDRGEGGEAKARQPRRMPKPSLGPLRSGEIPGIRGDHVGRPNATIALVLLSLFGYLALSWVSRADVALLTLDSELWRLATSTFTYSSLWYELAILLPLAIFGWLLERRHGPVLVIALFLACGVGANAIAVTVETNPFLLGAPGAALGMLACWAVPDLRRARAGEEHDADLAGVLAMAVVIALMPVATYEASAIATFAGGLLGLLTGLLLSRRRLA